MKILVDGKIIEKVNLLKGISFNDWQKIKIIMDATFNKEIGEFKRQLKLSCDDLIIPI